MYSPSFTAVFVFIYATAALACVAYIAIVYFTFKAARRIVNAKNRRAALIILSILSISIPAAIITPRAVWYYRNEQHKKADIAAIDAIAHQQPDFKTFIPIKFSDWYLFTSANYDGGDPDRGVEMQYATEKSSAHLWVREISMSRIQDPQKQCNNSRYSPANDQCTSVGKTGSGVNVSTDGLHYYADKDGTRVVLEEEDATKSDTDKTTLAQRQIANFEALFSSDPKNNARTSLAGR